MKKIIFGFALLAGSVMMARAQSQYQPYSYDFYQKLNKTVYSTHNRAHSAFKPYIVADSVLRPVYDSIMNYGSDASKSSAYRKLFTEHQIESNAANSTFYADLLPDLVVGRDVRQVKKTTSITSVGLQFGGTVGNKLSYQVAGYLNRAVFPDYITQYTNYYGVVPGQAYDRTPGKDSKQWSYITATVSYTPSKYINISAGRDRSFIGDGYRSLLLSDYASPAPFFRLNANVGDLQYTATWISLNDPMNANLNNYTSNRKKWGIFHYLDWNASNRFSIGFFDAIIAANEDDAGHKRGFDFSYLNPIAFMRPIEASNGSPDNVLIGFNSKYIITDGITLYGQFALDEFEAKNFFGGNGSSRNKFGWQLGVRGPNLFGVENLNYLVETNTATPYTYSERYSGINYSGNTESLAHPWGANFREVVGLLNYSYKRFMLSGEIDYGHYGLDIDGLNYGKDIYKDYRDAARETGNYIGQGLTTNMIYVEGKIGYLLNPKYNLRLELGGIIRNDKNDVYNHRTGMVSIGLRSSFRSMYNDLSGF